MIHEKIYEFYPKLYKLVGLNAYFIWM